MSVARIRRTHWSTLARREIEILNLAADGLSAIETGKKLFLTTATIKFHRTNLYRKIGAKNITHAVGIGFRTGLIPMDKENIEIRKIALAKLYATEDAAVEYAKALQNNGIIREEEYENFFTACDEFHTALAKVFEK